MKLFTVMLLASILLSSSGCEEPEVVQPEPKRADDRLTQSDIDSFLAIVESLPEQKLPSLPAVMLPAPQWSRNRTLPINELVKEEERVLADRKSIEWYTGHFPQSRFLKRALRRERLTIEQFVGLYLALGTTLSRGRVPADRDLDQILERGKRAIGELRKDQRIFSSLPEEQAYFLHEQSGWLAVVDRASRLKLVHPDNLTLATENETRLRTLLPAEFSRNPLQEFATILDDRGVPFQELSGQETDDHIAWSREKALVGSTEASPDEENR